MPETLTATTHVGITRLAGHIGAEITGADTGTPLSDEVVARIRQALLDHKVVFLRGQSLNYRRQVAFAQWLGPLTLGHPTLASPPGSRCWRRSTRSRAARSTTGTPTSPSSTGRLQAGDYLNTALVFSGIIMIAIIAL